jgi:RNA polymerase sigma-70 factor (ECF subfamily)
VHALAWKRLEGRPAMLVRDPGDPAETPGYFILLQWTGERVVNIRDFRFARYATDGAELIAMR